MPEIKTGTGATYSIGSDRYPYTVISVNFKEDGTPKTLMVQADKYERINRNDNSEQQEYVFSPNPSALIIFLTLRKNGRWVETGQPLDSPGRWIIGERQAYKDPSF